MFSIYHTHFDATINPLQGNTKMHCCENISVRSAGPKWAVFAESSQLIPSSKQCKALSQSRRFKLCTYSDSRAKAINHVIEIYSCYLLFFPLREDGGNGRRYASSEWIIPGIGQMRTGLWAPKDSVVMDGKVSHQWSSRRSNSPSINAVGDARFADTKEICRWTDSEEHHSPDDM